MPGERAGHVTARVEHEHDLGLRVAHQQPLAVAGHEQRGPHLRLGLQRDVERGVGAAVGLQAMQAPRGHVDPGQPARGVERDAARRAAERPLEAGAQRRQREPLDAGLPAVGNVQSVVAERQAARRTQLAGHLRRPAAVVMRRRQPDALAAQAVDEQHAIVRGVGHDQGAARAGGQPGRLARTGVAGGDLDRTPVGRCRHAGQQQVAVAVDREPGALPEPGAPVAQQLVAGELVHRLTPRRGCSAAARRRPTA